METQRIITIFSAALDMILRKLAFSRRGCAAVCACGEYRRQGRLELLHHSVKFSRRIEARVREIVRTGLRPVVILYGNLSIDNDLINDLLSLFRSMGVRCGAVLQIVRMQAAVSVGGWMLDGDDIHPIDFINVTGPGMLKLSVAAIYPLTSGNDIIRVERVDSRGGEVENETSRGEERDVGFLGEGNMGLGYERREIIENADICVVGLGRMGYAAVMHLVKLGAGRRGMLILIDGDILELANLDAVELPPEAVGMPKVEAMKRYLSVIAPGLNVVTIYGTISDQKAVEAMISSEVIFMCLDNDAGRAGGSLIAALYNRILFDMSGGAAYTRSRHVAVGGDVVCQIPGNCPCVACMRDVNWDVSFDELELTAKAEREKRESSDWRVRPGSCKAVISSVAGTGMMLFIRLVQGKLRRSVHFHFDSSEILPSWSDWSWRARRRRCRLYGKNGIGGLGDFGMKDERWT